MDGSTDITPERPHGSDVELVPGTGKLKGWVFWPSAIVILAFVGATLAFPEPMETAIGSVQSAIIANFSWWYALVALIFVFFCLYLG
ncbi:BCCT family transporter, partial [Micrococcus lylae]